MKDYTAAKYTSALIEIISKAKAAFKYSRFFWYANFLKGGNSKLNDIADAVSKARGKRVAANSVYRILDVFVGANIATRVESANAYIANAHPDCEHDCIFLVCNTCGQTTHIDDDHLSDGVRAAAIKAGFKPIRPVIEVKGICADCVG